MSLFGNLYEFAGNGPPVVRIEYAAAGMRVDANDLGARVFDQPPELGHLEPRYTEFRMNTGRFDVLVMTTALSRIDTHEQFVAAEQFRPGLQRIQIIERNLQAILETPCVFFPGCKIRRKQHS